MNYSKNNLICAYPDPTRDAHYACLVLEDNGKVIQVYPTPDDRDYENVVEWRDSIPQSSTIIPQLMIRSYKDAFGL
jgi:hypothetical protein